MSTDRLKAATALMDGFAARTGLTSAEPPRRYLWTDAFAVCNWLGLARATSQQRFEQLALRLIEQVHRVLGHDRPDAPRHGWLSGLGEAQAAEHPTRGGLRIGKPLPERPETEAFDERLEWDRDGQYFHYLTRWMRALDLATQATGDPRYNLWARELAATAHQAFVYETGAGKLRMYWKMSIDLTRPLVSSMGQLDPLDGYVTYAGLAATARRLGTTDQGPALTRELSSFTSMIGGADFATSDPLGIGGLLMDARQLLELQARGERLAPPLPASLLDAALRGLAAFQRQWDPDEPARYRLAFRELGLAIGLEAFGPGLDVGEGVTGERLRSVRQFAPLGDHIVEFWRDAEHRRAISWHDHQDINEVMLATALAPGGCLPIGVARP